jgi:hypothetical protein
VSPELRELPRYPARTPSAAIGHVHRAVDVRSVVFGDAEGGEEVRELDRRILEVLDESP